MKIHVVLDDGTLIDTIEHVEDYDPLTWIEIKEIIERGKRMLLEEEGR